MITKIPPWQVLAVRCFFFLVALWLFSFLRRNDYGITWGRSLLMGVATLSSLALVVTFLRYRWALVISAVMIVLLPLFFIVLMDVIIFSRSNAWYSIAFWTLVGMFFPVAFAYVCLTDAKVRLYYGGH